MPFGQRLLNPILTRTLHHPVMQELFHHRHGYALPIPIVIY